MQPFSSWETSPTYSHGKLINLSAIVVYYFYLKKKKIKIEMEDINDNIHLLGFFDHPFWQIDYEEVLTLSSLEQCRDWAQEELGLVRRLFRQRFGVSPHSFEESLLSYPLQDIRS